MVSDPQDRRAGDVHRLPMDPDVTVGPPPPTLRELWRTNGDLLPVIGAGGALGSLARWGVAEALPHSPDRVAWGTLLVNVAGSLLLGVLMALVLDVWSGRRYVRPFWGVGVLGGFTTFSTYELDARGLLAAGRPGVALGYLAGSLLAGLVAVALGVGLGRRLGRVLAAGPAPARTPGGDA